MNQERFLQFLDKILKIHSPSKHEADCAKFLAEYFSANQAEIDEAGNVFVKIPGVGEPVFWAAHMDVVDPSDQIELSTEGGFIKNKKPYVLGLDNKLAIACFVETMEILKEKNIAHRPIEILFTVEEETTSRGAIEFDYKKLSAKEGISIDSALPLGGIIVASPFYGNLDLQFSGPTHHAKAITAGEMTAWKIFSQIAGSLPAGVVDEHTNVNWASLDGGFGRNTVTEKFILRGEIRSFDKASYESVVQKISDLAKQFPVEQLVFKFEPINGGYLVSKDDVWLQKIVTAMVSSQVEDIKYIKDYGVSDINIFRPNYGLNVINLSSGSSGAHTKDETVSIQDVETTCNLLVELIKS